MENLIITDEQAQQMTLDDLKKKFEETGTNYLIIKFRGFELVKNKPTERYFDVFDSIRILDGRTIQEAVDVVYAKYPPQGYGTDPKYITYEDGAWHVYFTRYSSCD